MARRFMVPAALSAALLVSACVVPGEPYFEPVSLAGTQWQLRDLAGVPVAGEAWIGFEPGGQAGGNAGCNQFGGNYSRDGDDLTFGNLTATMMACVDPARMQTERGFIQALQATREATGSEALLELRDQQGRIVATLTRRA